MSKHAKDGVVDPGDKVDGNAPAGTGAMRSTTALVGAWLGLVILAFPGMPSWKRSLLEAVLILLWLLALVGQPQVRQFIASSPRWQLVGVAAVLATWFFAQVRMVPAHSFPLVAWHMYAEPRRNQDVVNYRLRVATCAGQSRLAHPRDLLGGVAVGRTRISQLYERLEGARTAADSSRYGALLDSTLTGLLVGDTRRRIANPLCWIALERVRLAAGDVGRANVAPMVEVVRRVATN